jgi:hypothetical protein
MSISVVNRIDPGEELKAIPQVTAMLLMKGAFSDPFADAIHESDYRAVTRYISKGYIVDDDNTDMLVEAGFPESMSYLERAVDSHDGRMVALLLLHGADPAHNTFNGTGLFDWTINASSFCWDGTLHPGWLVENVNDVATASWDTLGEHEQRRKYPGFDGLFRLLVPSNRKEPLCDVTAAGTIRTVESILEAAQSVRASNGPIANTLAGAFMAALCIGKVFLEAHNAIAPHLVDKVAYFARQVLADFPAKFC